MKPELTLKVSAVIEMQINMHKDGCETIIINSDGCECLPIEVSETFKLEIVSVIEKVNKILKAFQDTEIK